MASARLSISSFSYLFFFSNPLRFIPVYFSLSESLVPKSWLLCVFARKVVDKLFSEILLIYVGGDNNNNLTTNTDLITLIVFILYFMKQPNIENK